MHVLVYSTWNVQHIGTFTRHDWKQMNFLWFCCCVFGRFIEFLVFLVVMDGSKIVLEGLVEWDKRWTTLAHCKHCHSNKKTTQIESERLNKNLLTTWSVCGCASNDVNIGWNEWRASIYYLLKSLSCASQRWLRWQAGWKKRVSGSADGTRDMSSSL